MCVCFIIMTPSTNTNNFRALFYSETYFDCTDVGVCVTRVISCHLPVNVSTEACSLNVWQRLMNSVCVPQAPSNITLCSFLAVALNIVWDAGYLTAGLNWTLWSHAGGFTIYQMYVLGGMYRHVRPSLALRELCSTTDIHWAALNPAKKKKVFRYIWRGQLVLYLRLLVLFLKSVPSVSSWIQTPNYWAQMIFTTCN